LRYGEAFVNIVWRGAYEISTPTKVGAGSGFTGLNVIAICDGFGDTG